MKIKIMVLILLFSFNVYGESLDERLLDAKLDALKGRITSMDKALDIKAAEYERRFRELNNLRSDVTKDRDLLVRKDFFDTKITAIDFCISQIKDKLANIRETIVGKEVYNLKIQTIDSWILDTNEKLTKLMVQYDNRMTLVTLLSIIASLLTIINIWFIFRKKCI